MNEQEVLKQTEQIINEQANAIEVLQAQLNEVNINTNQQILEMQPRLRELLEMIKERSVKLIKIMHQLF
jgi:DNA-binding LytR/AlgR family response regulator